MARGGCVWAFLVSLAPCVWALEASGPAYRQLRGAAGSSPSGLSAEAAADQSGASFDGPIDHGIFTDKAAPPPAPGLKAPLVVGDPRRMSEPDNPLPKIEHDKLNPEDAGHGMSLGLRILGALLGAAICGGLGFFFFGPIGAAIGAAAGGLGGWFVTRK